MSDRKTILWADDDPDDLMLMRQVLKEINNNFKIIEVNNGRAAIEHLEDAVKDNNTPCLIILDMNMPVMNGKETLAVLKNDSSFKNIPVVVFTTSSSELDKLFCKRFNVEMMTKPPAYKHLKDAVEKLVSYCNA